MPFKYIIPLKRITNKYSAWSISSLNLPKNHEQSVTWKFLTTFENAQFWHCKKVFFIKKEQQQKRLVQHGLDEICSRGQRKVIFISLKYLIREPVFGSNLTKLRSVQQNKQVKKWHSSGTMWSQGTETSRFPKASSEWLKMSLDAIYLAKKPST